VDAKTGGIGVSVYDRTSGATEQLFLPIFLDGLEAAKPEPRLLRAQWMADGQAILVAWPGTPENQDHDGLNLALVPVVGRGTTKLFYVPEIEEPMQQLSRPLALAGSRLFVLGTSNRIARLDLDTGAIRTHPCAGEIMLYPSPGGDQLLYVQKKPGEEEKGKLEFGRMNPSTFAQRPELEFTNAMAEGVFFAVSADEKSVATVENYDGAPRLVIRRRGQTDFTRSLKVKGEKLRFGNAAFSPKGDVVYATYLSVAETSKKSSYGLMEIPVADKAIRQTTLIPEASSSKEELILYLQFGLSHDGKTAAVATTYLAFDDEALRGENCALFLVDLSDPGRKVTKVPIPLPSNRKLTNK
jgi:hypothetical protein